jgi:S1-C subfamily serine protease
MTRRAKIFCLSFLVMVLCCSFAGANQAVNDAANVDDRFADLIERVKPSIVAVGTYYFNDIPKAGYLGTGFAVRDGKRLVTNFHVVSPVMGQGSGPVEQIPCRPLPV